MGTTFLEKKRSLQWGSFLAVAFLAVTVDCIIQSWNFSVPGRNFPVPSRDRILKLGPGPAVPGPNLNFLSRDGTRPVPPSRPVPKHKIFRNYIFKSMVDPSTRVLWNRSGYANYVLRLSAAILNTDFKKD